MIMGFNYIRYLHICLLLEHCEEDYTLRTLWTWERREYWAAVCPQSLRLSLGIHCPLQSISINYHRYFKMINAFYLSFDKSMASLRLCQHFPHLSAQSIGKSHWKIYIEDVWWRWINIISSERRGGCYSCDEEFNKRLLHQQLTNCAMVGQKESGRHWASCCISSMPPAVWASEPAQVGHLTGS